MSVTALKKKPMAKKKDTTGAGDGRGRPRSEPTIPVSARLPESLVAAMDRYINATRPVPTTKAVLIDALERYLKEKGFWPPSEEAE